MNGFQCTNFLLVLIIFTQLSVTYAGPCGHGDYENYKHGCSDGAESPFDHKVPVRKSNNCDKSRKENSFCCPPGVLKEHDTITNDYAYYKGCGSLPPP
ncbi:hypothetical protein MJO29_007442 [Puccinia striiformis f. sp. tritici]|uniref:hypothetical protein n=1 Tax=Puccinia striiformis f. sp. tritici TaxID=168172 RepID=UPI002007C327|nr:hypothetical protein Pst134EA_013611 [Puccinia striiformis f. sp. tritici]KAI9604000.1 hypothetical protein H4Q26_003610 [Puccinia striiformis f. sp. tritici PST-130]KAH9454521.1 hypothetical protein Pst134EB_014597 [Puccinia striiformis f. sp. tritici]KAH9465742.1 hypothetical protein Pst134EA_013611 [Puccinia striiformis f. sp. tritici]KAI7956043.1 hypothetical protein MJO29_007442 [Puccinia striiformis f. sp. tritici]KAI9612423.1 hypothetical protein KEM48_004155 [Puccinia striiformis f.